MNAKVLEIGLEFVGVNDERIEINLLVFVDDIAQMAGSEGEPCRMVNGFDRHIDYTGQKETASECGWMKAKLFDVQ